MAGTRRWRQARRPWWRWRRGRRPRVSAKCRKPLLAPVVAHVRADQLAPGGVVDPARLGGRDEVAQESSQAVGVLEVREVGRARERLEARAADDVVRVEAVLGRDGAVAVP